jgi:hypothetical protein
MFKFKHPFTCLISGPTQSGKTYFVENILKNISKTVEPPPTKIIWCYGEYQDRYNNFPDNIILCEGLTGLDEIDKNEKNLLIIDDLMQEVGNNSEIAELFTKGSHHRNLSVILIVQNLFHQGKIMRTVSLNAHYLVIFKNPRDAGQIRHLSQQLFPGKAKFLVDAYKQATVKPHGYLVLDFKQSTPENRRVLSDIYPPEEGYYYIPK